MANSWLFSRQLNVFIFLFFYCCNFWFIPSIYYVCVFFSTIFSVAFDLWTVAQAGRKRVMVLTGTRCQRLLGILTMEHARQKETFISSSLSFSLSFFLCKHQIPCLFGCWLIARWQSPPHLVSAGWRAIKQDGVKKNQPRSRLLKYPSFVALETRELGDKMSLTPEGLWAPSTWHLIWIIYLYNL